MKLNALIGSGHKIGLFILPFLVVGLVLNITNPLLFSVGGPPVPLKMISIIILAIGIVIWAWSVILILLKVPKGQLITNGPFGMVNHPLYTGVALLVLPWVGFLLNSWLGTLLGIVLYIGSRLFSPEEEAKLLETFGPAWNEYKDKVKIPWL